MNKSIIRVIAALAISTIIIFACVGNKSIATEEPPHIVFVVGDEEYRSEESMPMLGEILKREMGAKISLAFSIDSAGYIDPNRSDHMEGLGALKTADLMVMFTRFRALPDDQLNMILDYAESGKPMVGFRTTTHAFMYVDENEKLDSSKIHLYKQWPVDIFGQRWITHHGHFDDGANPLTSITELDDKHPILRGFDPFPAYSWLYHVDGGEHKLGGNPHLLIEGKSLKSNHEMNDRLDQFPITNPVAWTKTYKGKSGIDARVFFTTLGHPYDFKSEEMRQLALNGIYWALGKEDAIPEDGVNPKLVSPYEPNNSGFGQKFKKGIKPKYSL